MHPPVIKGAHAEYAMRTRMWQHGIHGFLELLPHCLPHSVEHLLAFYLAYNMIALLVELVPAFEVVAKRRSSLVQPGCRRDSSRRKTVPPSGHLGSPQLAAALLLLHESGCRSTVSCRRGTHSHPLRSGLPSCRITRPTLGGADEGAMDATGLLLPPTLWDGVRWNRCGSRHRRGG